MATARSNEAICSLVEDGTLQLEGEVGRVPDYRGLVVSADMLMVVDYMTRKLRLHSNYNGKLLATPHELESRPVGMCLNSNTEVAVIMENSTIEILSFEFTDGIKQVKRLHLTTGFDRCEAVAKVESIDKFVVSGSKRDRDMDRSIMYWCVLSRTDGHVDTIHRICKVGLDSRSHLAIKSNTVYISCDGHDSPDNTGVYSYSISNPNTRKFLYHHSDLKTPRGLTVDTRGYIFVCNSSPCNIHQLTDRGELVTIHRVASWPLDIFYEEQHGVLYITCPARNEITRYRLDYLHQQGVPVEILNMDDRSIQLFEEALKDGKETVYSIRVMVVGSLGVGKTTLIKRLLGEEVNISERHSTEGIDIYVNCCDVSLSTSEWTRQNKNSEQDHRLQRLVRVLNEQQSVRDKVTDKDQDVIPPQGETADSNASVTVKEQVIIPPQGETADSNASVTDKEQVIILPQGETADSNTSVTDNEQVIIPPQGETADSNASVTDNEQLIIPPQGETADSNASVTDKEQVVIPPQGETADSNASVTDKEQVMIPLQVETADSNASVTDKEQVMIPLQVETADSNASVTDKEQVIIPPQEETADSNASVTDKEQLIMLPQGETADSNASVTDNEQVIIPPQGEAADNNASVTDKEQVIIPPQGERTLKSIEGAHVAVEDKNTEVLYCRSPQQDLGQDFSATASQLEESPSTLVQRKLTQSETNTMPMLKLLRENADKLKQDRSKNALLTIWDFAGQYAFYTTHQTFLTRRAIYLLVSDVSEQVTNLVADECYFDSKGIMKCKVHELIEVWLNSIHSCAPSPKASIPPVILVGTHVDKILQGNHHEICMRYFREIRTYLKDKPTRFHLVDEDFAIDNTLVDRKLKDLKRKIVEVASQQPYWGEKIPARWILMEQELMRRKAAGVKVISLKDVENINQEGTVQIEKSEELDLFLRFLHETGIIIYFSIEVLRDNIVLDPTWLIDALKSLINAQPNLAQIPADNGSQSTRPADSAVTQKWSDFKEKGILTLELVDAIWTKEKHPELHAHRDHILLIMEQLDIIAKPRSLSEIGEKVSTMPVPTKDANLPSDIPVLLKIEKPLSLFISDNEKVENYFLTPCMLRQESPREVISPEQNHRMVSTSALCCVFTGKFLPPPIFHRLIAACVARWPVAKKTESSENLIFCGCCVFDLDPFHRLTLHCRNHVVFARITRMVIDEVNTPDAKLCTRVRRFITLNLSKITSYLGQSLQYELHVQCQSSQSVPEDGMVPCQVWFADEGQDSDVSITREHMNYARLCIALVTVCGNALREILLTHVPTQHTNIYQAILANKTDLTSRRSGKPALLNQDQIHVVFPDPWGRYMATVDQFDISLLYILVRNVSTVPAPLMDWGSEPIDQPFRDRSLGASVERIRLYRNLVSGHSAHGMISQQDFKDYWNKIDAVLHDIEDAIGRRVYSLELDRQQRQVITIYEAC